jgi:uncharacterized spore protein YtfJ
LSAPGDPNELGLPNGQAELDFIESLRSTATVKSVFGEPIQMEGKTVVPIAKVAYHFGGGFGSKPKSGESRPDAKQEGGGGGGDVKAFPAGALEITPNRTSFVPLHDALHDCGLLLAGFAAGALVGAAFSLRRVKP